MVALILALIFGGGTAWAKTRKSPAPGPLLWIVADRIVGFVPFTVSLYGKIVGAVPDQVELCRSPVQPMGEATTMGRDEHGARSAGRGADSMEARGRPETLPTGPVCEGGNLSRTSEGFDYSHAVRFDRPGTYQVRLQMIDTQGKRTLSNPVQVNAH
jgi:hypothetical protein